MEVDILRQRRILQITETHAEPGLISDLMLGAYIRDLRRFYFLYRVNLIVKNVLDSVLEGKEKLQES